MIRLAMVPDRRRACSPLKPGG